MYIYKIKSIEGQSIEELKKQVSHERVDKAMRMKHDEDKLRSLLVEKLLNEVLIENKLVDFTPITLEYDRNGKPSVKDKTDLFISLSHSGNYVACIVADTPCGIDIEKTDRNYDVISGRIFSEDENEEKALQVFGKDFYAIIWTLKEAVVKAMGVGIVKDFREFSVLSDRCIVDETVYNIKVADAPDGYALSIALRE